VQRFIEDLNRLYLAEPALWEGDYDHHGFAWLDCSDHENSVMSFLRWPASPKAAPILVVLNLTPVPRSRYRLGLPRGGCWKEVMNSDAEIFGGGNQGNWGGVQTEEVPSHGHPQSVAFMLPPLSVMVFRAGD
jgi:1,4-alpha-glucan branching enzyme